MLPIYFGCDKRFKVTEATSNQNKDIHHCNVCYESTHISNFQLAFFFFFYINENLLKYSLYVRGSNNVFMFVAVIQCIC